jgi:hypothetical protein
MQIRQAKCARRPALIFSQAKDEGYGFPSADNQPQSPRGSAKAVQKSKPAKQENRSRKSTTDIK